MKTIPQQDDMTMKNGGPTWARRASLSGMVSGCRCWALAKTITFRTLATTMDFTTNYVVVGDLAMAVARSASGFILGPFVYLGHEMAWDYFGSPRERTLDLPAPTNLLPAPV
jgi:uncharacterized membrane protein